jgi:ABC-type transport system involved in Fe-S cluster assembly fused permease/ATPase subunit
MAETALSLVYLLYKKVWYNWGSLTSVFYALVRVVPARIVFKGAQKSCSRKNEEKEIESFYQYQVVKKKKVTTVSEQRKQRHRSTWVRMAEAENCYRAILARLQVISVRIIFEV